MLLLYALPFSLSIHYASACLATLASPGVSLGPYYPTPPVQSSVLSQSWANPSLAPVQVQPIQVFPPVPQLMPIRIPAPSLQSSIVQNVVQPNPAMENLAQPNPSSQARVAESPSDQSEHLQSAVESGEDYPE
ncbi:unnamed protein product [Heligmosomoides polygyrus]|uniref:RNA-binding protein 12-like n=1 Tax=Heligmosomoides polygyrus TaxID=6339 RepID=A0A183F871_HELPZ|nr:unnamed protein product [Heligmosomoides polygyrus]